MASMPPSVAAKPVAEHSKIQRAVLLLAHGTPDELEDIPKYLSNVVSGRPMPHEVVEEITHRYGLIGKSPLTALTLKQGSLLAEALGVPVYVGMRTWKPYIADVVRQMKEDGIDEIAAICLAPQNSRTSVGLYRRAAFAEAGEHMRIDFTEGWAEHPMLADAFADRLHPVLTRLQEETGETATVLFTAHSVPCRTIQIPAEGAAPARPGMPMPAPAPGEDPAVWKQSSATVARQQGRPVPSADPYPVEAKRTAAAIVERTPALDEAHWCFAFQSQGMSGGPWIGPSVEDTLTALHGSGVKAVVLQTIGFLCDHVEILYDIDIAFKEFAEDLGMRLERPASLNDSALLTKALVDLAEKSFARLDQPALPGIDAGDGGQARADIRPETGRPAAPEVKASSQTEPKALAAH
jgi:ferrochelatase